MSALIDAACPSCRRRFGWAGTMADCPACPRCGYQLDRTALKHDEAELANFRQFLGRRKQRIDAGLTLRRAAELLGVSAMELSEIEQGLTEPSEEMTRRMAKVYRTGSSNRSNS